jgi:hypothetical protein
MQTARLCSVIFVALALVLSVGPVRAAVYTLTDGNSSFTVDPFSQAGAYGWVVDGTSVLYQQWFWYSAGGTEASIDTLPLISATPSGAAELTLLYGSTNHSTGKPNNFTVSIQYTLTGEEADTFTSDVGETIAITNYSGQALPFKFFQYSDFDLSAADTVVIDPSLRFVDQYPDSTGLMVGETTDTPKPSHAEANNFSNTLTKLNTGVAHLDDILTAGPGNVTWAFEWDKTLTASGMNSALIISKDKNLAPVPTVPEPAAILGFGTILLLVGRKLSGRQV